MTRLRTLHKQTERQFDDSHVSLTELCGTGRGRTGTDEGESEGTERGCEGTETEEAVLNEEEILTVDGGEVGVV